MVQTKLKIFKLQTRISTSRFNQHLTVLPPVTLALKQDLFHLFFHIMFYTHLYIPSTSPWTSEDYSQFSSLGKKPKKKLGLGLWRCLLITCLRIYALFKNMYLCIYIYIYMHSVHVSFHGAASELYFQTRARAICSQQGHQAQHVSTAGFSYQKPWSCRFSSPLSVPLRASLAGVQLI